MIFILAGSHQPTVLDVGKASDILQPKTHCQEGTTEAADLVSPNVLGDAS